MLKKSIIKAIQVSSHVAYMVVIPIVVFGGAGLWLDRRLGTLPEYLLIGLGIAFVTTTIWMTKRLKEVVESMD